MRVARKATIAGVALGVALTGGACSSSGSAATSSSPASLIVLAASSLKSVFPEIADQFSAGHPGTTVTFSFGGTDALAAQIEQGAPADVFAGASKAYGDQLEANNLIEPWIGFCSNKLVAILPASNPAGITSLQDLTKPGIKLVVAAESVPAGAYTRTVLSNLDASLGTGYSASVLANVVSEENAVDAVVTKVRLGEADAGFAYVTDARAAGSALKTIELLDAAQAVVVYPIAPVSASTNTAVAGQFVDFVLSPPAQQLLREAGFGPPPLGS